MAWLCCGKHVLSSCGVASVLHVACVLFVSVGVVQAQVVCLPACGAVVIIGCVVSDLFRSIV